MVKATLVHIDGLPGPTFNYGGLSLDNRHSIAHAMSRSSPQRAALQSLYKMKHMTDMGLHQIVLPPQERPAVYTLRSLGFSGSDIQVLESAYRNAPDLVTLVSSSSSTWAGSGATITPSSDTGDGRVHLTPANLAAEFHRSLEVPTTQMIYYALFVHPEAFMQHEPLPNHRMLGDEGSANQLRLCGEYGDPGVHMMVYGRRSYGSRPLIQPQQVIARQSLEACQALVRLHRMDENRVLYVQQNPEAIDAGVFHNDLAALANQHVLLYHERAWLRPDEVLKQLEEKLATYCQRTLCPIKISEHELPLQELASSYLLNSQLITRDSDMILLAPVETRQHQAAHRVIQRILSEDNPVKKIQFYDLSESMRAGGGPRSLSIPLVLTQSELQATFSRLVMTDGLYHDLVDWVRAHYRDELLPGDVADPELLYETRRALDELTDLLDLGPLYPFQQD